MQHKSELKQINQYKQCDRDLNSNQSQWPSTAILTSKQKFLYQTRPTLSLLMHFSSSLSSLIFDTIKNLTYQ